MNEQKQRLLDALNKIDKFATMAIEGPDERLALSTAYDTLFTFINNLDKK